MFGYKWDDRFIEMAKLVGSWSKDPGTKVGAVIVRPDRTIASVGYNGFPRGVDDKYRSREDKLLRTVHAEANAILTAKESLSGYHLYVYPLCPCSNCAALIIQSGIKYVVAEMPVIKSDWAASFDAAGEMFKEAGVEFSVQAKEGQS